LNNLRVYGDNIQIDFEILDGRPIYEAQDRDKWRAAVNTAANFGVHKMLEI
jgi:hypothetical protein